MVSFALLTCTALLESRCSILSLSLTPSWKLDRRGQYTSSLLTASFQGICSGSSASHHRCSWSRLYSTDVPNLRCRTCFAVSLAFDWLWNKTSKDGRAYQPFSERSDCSASWTVWQTWDHRGILSSLHAELNLCRDYSTDKLSLPHLVGFLSCLALSFVLICLSRELPWSCPEGLRCSTLISSTNHVSCWLRMCSPIFAGLTREQAASSLCLEGVLPSSGLQQIPSTQLLSRMTCCYGGYQSCQRYPRSTLRVTRPLLDWQRNQSIFDVQYP